MKNNKITKEKKDMATLAIPKKSSYILKKDCVKKIVDSKVSKNKEIDIKENAKFFLCNNIVKK